MLLGRCHYHQNKFTKALYEFDIVLSSASGNQFQGEAAYWTAEVYQKDEDFKKALEFYQKVIDDFPSSRYLSHAIYSKGWCYYKLGVLEDGKSSMTF